MSLGITILKRGHQIGGLESRLVDLLFDNSYPAGGEPLSGAEVGLNPILAAVDTNSGVGDGPYRFKYNAVTLKLQAFRSGAGGVQVYSQGDIKGSSNTNAENTDTATEPTGAAAVAAYADVSTTWAHGAISNPDIPRNVGIVIKNATGGNLNLYVGVMTFTVTGTFRGAAQTETITFTSTSGNKAVGHAPDYRVKYGVKPFDTVTNVTLDHVPDDTFSIGVCRGSKLGLPSTPANNAEADIIRLTKNAAFLSPSGLYSTNQTVNFDTLADGDDISVEYNAAGGMVEVADTADLSAVTARLLLFG